MDAYITKYVQLTPAERTRLLGGAPVVKLLQSDPASEVAAFGAVWINGSPAEYVQLVRDIEQFERGGAFLVTKRISDPPQLADFSALKFSPAGSGIASDLPRRRLRNQARRKRAAAHSPVCRLEQAQCGRGRGTGREAIDARIRQGLRGGRQRPPGRLSRFRPPDVRGLGIQVDDRSAARAWRAPA